MDPWGAYPPQALHLNGLCFLFFLLWILFDSDYDPFSTSDLFIFILFIRLFLDQFWNHNCVPSITLQYFWVICNVMFYMFHTSWYMQCLHGSVMAVSILSCNIKDLNFCKYWLVLKEFRSSNIDVVMVQEMHFRAEGSFKFSSKYFPTAFVAFDPSSKVGVVILFKHSSSIQIKSFHLDPHSCCPPELWPHEHLFYPC